jgi:integrase
VRGQVRPSSHRRYSDYVRLHLIPEIGKTPLAKLTAQQVQSLYARKLSEGLSQTTVHMLHGGLHRALKDAERMGLVPRNVSEPVRAPRRNSAEIQTLTEEQSSRFLAAAQGDRFHALYVLALTTGMRQGELLALHWQDVDWERGSLSVRRHVQETSTAYVLAEPKTEGLTAHHRPHQPGAGRAQGTPRAPAYGTPDARAGVER